MRILLQHRLTGLYLQEDLSWTRQSTEALDFLSSSTAIDFCATNRLSEVQLVFKFDEHKYEIVVPMCVKSEPLGQVLRSQF